MLMKYINLTKNEKKTKKKINFNYGLAILKSLLAFSVISTHYFKQNSTKNKIILFLTKNRKLHVPSFFIISFYLMSEHLLSLSIKYLLRRIKRLLIPYIIWPIIVWIINHILNILLKSQLFPSSIQVLKLQLLWGCIFMPQFWFQWDLIIITLFFYMINLIFINHALFILQLLLLLSYICQYSEYHYKNIFMKYNYYNRYTIGRLFETIPFGVTGFSFGFYNYFNILKNLKGKTLILSLIIYNIVKDYNIFSDIKGLSYQGINLNIQSICIISIFVLFPINSNNNYYLIKFLSLITNHSAGIFYLHVTIHSYFQYYIEDIKKGTFFGIILNYCICYSICQIGMFFFSKTEMKYLFS